MEKMKLSLLLILQAESQNILPHRWPLQPRRDRPRQNVKHNTCLKQIPGIGATFPYITRQDLRVASKFLNSYYFCREGKGEGGTEEFDTTVRDFTQRVFGQRIVEGLIIDTASLRPNLPVAGRRFAPCVFYGRSPNFCMR
jgi:hypothetical protein